MMRPLLAFFLLVPAASAPGGLLAQTAKDALEQAQARLPKGAGVDLEHGRDVILGKAECATVTCTACFQCHQVSGQGNAALAIPRLTGQTYRYLYDSLRDFASGRRLSDAMTPIAKSLPPESWRDAAAFYSLQQVQVHGEAKAAAAAGTAHPERLAHGVVHDLLRIAERGVQGCVNCHGPQGAGLPPSYPYLAGQYAQYIEQRLKKWRAEQTDPPADAYGIMQEIAQRLRDDEIRDVAEYYAAIRPPRVVRDENYADPLETGAPLGAQRLPR